MTHEKEREAFEEWAYATGNIPWSNLAREWLWKGWQARAAAKPVVDEVNLRRELHRFFADEKRPEIKADCLWVAIRPYLHPQPQPNSTDLSEQDLADIMAAKVSPKHDHLNDEIARDMQQEAAGVDDELIIDQMLQGARLSPMKETNRQNMKGALKAIRPYLHPWIASKYETR